MHHSMLYFTGMHIMFAKGI